MKRPQISRRKALQIGTAAAALPLVHIRTAGAAGKLAVAFWDHWVPTGNDVMKKQVAAWSDKSKVEVQADFLNQSLLPTAAAEQQARAGHDIYSFPTWEVHNHQDALEPVDDVVKSLTDAFGAVNPAVEYLGKVKGHWLAVPGSSGTQIKGPCGRISLLKQMAGLDVLEMYPAKDVHTTASDNWTYDAHLKAAEACFKGGKAFGMGLGQTSDSVDSIGAIFTAYGAELVNAKGDITVNSDAVHQVLEHCQKLIKFFPADAVSYDDASNNKALISGQSALIWNPPSAWAVAVRDQPDVGKDCWTFPAPAGPKGRFTPYLPYYWGIWNFSSNKTAAKELIDLPDAEGPGARALHGGDGLRPAALCGHARFQGVGGSGAAGRHRVQLPDPRLAARGREYRVLVGAARHRGADLQSRNHADHACQNARRPDDRAGDRLGQRRAGRLHPLTV